MIMIVTALGGLGLFIYGMTLMGDSLQKAAGSRLREILEYLTRNKIMGILLGTIVTVLIQSSSATTVMVVGFVNAGIMNLTQAFSVIMGANLGTTITSQIIAFKLTDFAPIAIAVGVGMKLIFKTKNKKDVADIIIGFGLLFAGLQMMSQGLSPLKDNPLFSEIILKLENPILGLITGFLITTIVQSSSATIGILQALALQGLIPFGVAFSIILGENIGTTTTALLSSVGASKNARRAALLHFLFNAIGSIIFLVGLRYPVGALILRLSPGDTVRQIANAHTFFNLTNVLLQAPFSAIHIKLVNYLVKGDDEADGMALKYLDYRMIETPSLATSQIIKEINRMFGLVVDSIILVSDAVINGRYELVENIEKNESLINYLEDEITKFIVKLNRNDSSEGDNNLKNIFIYTLNDVERMGDHISNISEVAEIVSEQRIAFSDIAKEELGIIFSLSTENIKTAQAAFENFDPIKAKEVFEIEDKIDALEDEYRNSHIQRLSDGTCEVKSGIMFLDIISNLERISDHCTNVAGYVYDEKKDA